MFYNRQNIHKEAVTTNREIVANHLAYTHLYMFLVAVNMVTGIILIWILIKLQAPTWLFWLVGVRITISIFEILQTVYKIGKKS